MPVPFWHRRTALYRLYDASDALIYIGIAFDPPKRWYAQSVEKAWWPEVARKEIVCWYDTRTEAFAAETKAIRVEKPRYNIDAVLGPVAVRPRRPKVGPELAAELASAGRAYGRTKRAHERARLKLIEAVRRARTEGVKPSEIRKLTGNQLTDSALQRLLKD